MDFNTLVVIGGPQRSGTTFLVELFHSLGFFTGFGEKKINLVRDSWHHGGLEYFNKPRKTIPEIVKSPWSLDNPYTPSFFLEQHGLYPKYYVATHRNYNEIRRSQNLLNSHRGKRLIRKDTHLAFLEHQEKELPIVLNHWRPDTTILRIQFPFMVEYVYYLYRKLKRIFDEKSLDFVTVRDAWNSVVCSEFRSE